MNDTWVYQDGAWYKMSSSGALPRPRSGHRSVYHNNSLIIVGTKGTLMACFAHDRLTVVPYDACQADSVNPHHALTCGG
jgi:hypothetical protein